MPVAVGRTAGAVGGIADSGVVVRLTRGRLWIGMLAVLLVGIVALNVMALSFSSSSSAAGRQAEALNRQNSGLRAEIAGLMSSEQVNLTAGRLGLHVPNPDQIGYLRPSSGDAAEAARRLRAGELSAIEYVPETDPALAPTAPATEVAVAETAPDSEAPAVTVPTPETSPPADPAAPAVTATITGGGVSSP